MTQHGGASARPHPYEHELADLIDGALDSRRTTELREHVSTCVACQVVLQSAGDGVEGVSNPNDSAGGGAVLPEVLRTALVSEQVAPPLPGQLWRLRGQDPWETGEIADLAIIVAVDNELLVAPVTADPQLATDLWTAQLTVLGTDITVAVWVSLTAAVGWEVLDVHLGAVEANAVSELHTAIRRGHEPPRGWRLGRVVDEELQHYRESLRSRFIKLSESRLVAIGAQDDELEGSDGSIDGVTALKKAGWTPTQLKTVTGLSAAQARAVLDGHRTLTSSQANAVGAALDTQVTIPAVQPVPGWLQAIATPIRRHRFERVATVTRGGDAWQLRAQQAQEHLVAARGNVGSEVDWEALAEQQLVRLETDAGLRS